METVTKKEITIFLASSAELRKDRDLFGDFVLHLNNHYKSRGLFLQLDKWEYLDDTKAFDNNRTQDEYNKHVCNCDAFVCLFHTKAGEFTQEEFKLASGECYSRGLPLFIYFRRLTLWDKIKGVSDSLGDFKKTCIESELQYFWGEYGTNDKLHLDFVLWLDSYLFDGKSELKTENGTIVLGDVKVADLSQLSFAINNNKYQQLEGKLKSLNSDIEQLQHDIQNYPDDKRFSERLSQKQIEHDKIEQEFERQQDALLGAAKQIAEMRKKQVGKKLQEAIEAFEEGQLDLANKLLRELEKDGDQLMAEINTKNEQMHELIEAQLLQTKTVIADLKKPIEDRITRVNDIYAKADDWAARNNYDKKKYAQLLFNYAKFLNDYGYYKKAEQIYLRQITLSEEQYGIDSIRIAKSYNNIALVCVSLGDYAKALEYYFKALDIFEKVLDSDRSDTAILYCNIGMVYSHLGNYAKALEYYFKALDISEKVLGSDQSLAASYLNIGVVYYKQGEYTKALEYYLKALDISEKVLGIDHTYTAMLYGNTAIVYSSQGNNDKAFEYCFKALAINEKVVGVEHPNTAISFSQIGYVINNQGDYEKALEYYFKALDIQEKVLGVEHHSTAMSYNYIGKVYDNLGNYEKALEYYFKALDIFEKVLGVEHPDTASSYDNIGLVYFTQGDYEKALEYYFKALDIYEKVLEIEYQNAAESYNNISCVYYNLGYYDKALECLKKAQTIIENKLDHYNPFAMLLQEHIKLVKDAMEWEGLLEDI